MNQIHAEWRRAPPLRKIAAGFAGYKPPRETPIPAPGAPSNPAPGVSIDALRAAFGNGRL